MRVPAWNVYIYNINLQKIEVYNIFNHGSFNRVYYETLIKITSKEEFAKKLKSELMYWFWGKCEWEIEIVDWLGTQKSGLKTDAYKQIMLNFDAFVDYLWKFQNKKGDSN